MTHEKTCLTCNYKEVKFDVPPCSECEDTQHDFIIYSKWMERNV